MASDSRRKAQAIACQGEAVLCTGCGEGGVEGKSRSSKNSRVCLLWVKYHAFSLKRRVSSHLGCSWLGGEGGGGREGQRGYHELVQTTTSYSCRNRAESAQA